MGPPLKQKVDAKMAERPWREGGYAGANTALAGTNKNGG